MKDAEDEKLSEYLHVKIKPSEKKSLLRVVDKLGYDNYSFLVRHVLKKFIENENKDEKGR